MPINIRMHPKEVLKLSPKILVIGVGGAGGNAVNNMIGAGLDGVEFLVCNTDNQALERSYCETRLQLGENVTGGLGAGAKPEIGREAAEESIDDVMRYLDGVNMVFVTAGMGGGTGTGAAPVIAKAAREKGILTVGVVTKPFRFEGSYRMKMAEAGIDQMQDYVDTLIVIPNQNLFRVANEKTTFAEAFRLADSVLQSAVKGVTDLMIRPLDVNLDFADIRSVMLEMGKAMMGTGEATGDDRATRAAEAAINNPLLDDVSMKGARGVIINVSGGSDMTLFEVDQACNYISQEVDPDANIIFGSSTDESLTGMMRVTVVATGMDVAEDKSRNGVAGGRGWSPGISTERRTLDRLPLENARQVEPSYQTPMSYAQMAQAARPVTPLAAVSAFTRKLETELETPARRDHALRGFAAGDITGKKPDAAAPQQAQPDLSQGFSRGTPLRGAVVNNAFIPPAAAEADKTRADTYSAQIHSQSPRHIDINVGDGMAAPAPAQAFAAPQQPVYEPVQSSLLPPVRPAATEAVMADAMAGAEPSSTVDLPALAPQAAPGFMRRAAMDAPMSPRRRAASLLDRLTSTLRSSHETADIAVIGQPTGVLPEPEVRSRSVVSSRDQGRPEQGNLAIDAPSIKAEQALDDELDIPAFLRRQAN